MSKIGPVPLKLKFTHISPNLFVNTVKNKKMFPPKTIFKFQRE